MRDTNVSSAHPTAEGENMDHLGVSFVALDDAVQTSGSDVVDVARATAASAAERGVPLKQVLDRIERAYAAIDAEMNCGVVRAVAEAWVERAALSYVDMSCENPITTLAGIPHLHSRLFDIYRRAERDGSRGGDRHVLVVVELAAAPGGHELESSLRALDVADVLRQVFTGDETVAQLSPRRFAVLAERTAADPLTVHTAALVLRRDLPHDGEIPPRVWVEELPPSTDEVLAVLAILVC